MPKGSLTLGITYKSAIENTREISRPRKNPVNSTLCPMPSVAAISIMRWA